MPNPQKYYRIMLGRGSVHAEEAQTGGFIGADFDIDQDLTNRLPEVWREFSKKFIPVYLQNHPGKSKIAAGLSCGFLWTVSKGIKTGDIVLCPDGQGFYLVGEVVSDYEYKKGEVLPHRRKVCWYGNKIDRTQMSPALRNSAGAIGTVSNISQHAGERTV